MRVVNLRDSDWPVGTVLYVREKIAADGGYDVGPDKSRDWIDFRDCKELTFKLYMKKLPDISKLLDDEQGAEKRTNRAKVSKKTPKLRTKKRR